MLQLQFTPLLTARTPVVCAEVCFHLVGTDLRDSKSERSLAHYEGSCWSIKGEYHSSLIANQPVFVEFLDSESHEVVGGFEKLSINGPAIWADRQLIAQLREDGRWLSVRTKVAWPEVMLCPADSERTYSRATE